MFEIKSPRRPGELSLNKFKEITNSKEKLQNEKWRKSSQKYKVPPRKPWAVPEINIDILKVKSPWFKHFIIFHYSNN